MVMITFGVRGHIIFDLWRYTTASGPDIPRSHRWYVTSAAGVLTVEHASWGPLGVPQLDTPRRALLRHWDLRNPNKPFPPGLWRRFHLEHSEGHTIVSVPFWFAALVAGPLPAWKGWRWVASPRRRRQLRGFEVQPPVQC
jgi:hypothetical protein